MAMSDAERLREIVSDYYHGLITPESYRQRRAELLDHLGEIVDEPADVTVRGRTAPAPDRKEEVEPAARAANSVSKVILFAGATVFLVAAAAIVLWIRSPATDSVEVTADPQASATAAVTGAGDALLQEFLSRNQWSEDSLASLISAWEALDENQRAVAAESRLARRFVGRLQQRIRDESALETTTPSRRLQAMTALATRIGAAYEAPVPIDTAPANEDDPVTQEPSATQDAAVGSGVEPTDFGEPSDGSTADVPSVEIRPAAADTASADTAQESDSAAPADSPAEAATDAAPQVDEDDPCPAALANSRRPYCQDSLSVDGNGPALVVLRPGAFDMGSDANDEESPVRKVSIGGSIAMSRDEISVAEFARFCDAMDDICPEAPWGAGDYPVVSVSWEDANRFAEWLSTETGYRYRLPSEAEWEYAARAGTQSPFSFGDEVTPSAAHSSANGPVDAPLPRHNRSVNRNQFRLYHMSGNVREWVQDDWHPNYEGAPADGSVRSIPGEDSRVVRGGSYSDLATNLRSAARHPLDRTHKDSQTGFRVLREVNQASY